MSAAAPSSPLDASLSLLAESNPDVAPTPAAAAAPSPAPATAARVPLAATAAEKSGWMVKNSYTHPDSFKRYWFVLADNRLDYFESPDSAAPRGSIQLEGCSCDITPESKYGLPACFELNSPIQSRLYALGCEGQEEMQLWINVIRKCMLKIRRQKAKESSQKKRAAVEGAAADSQAQQAQQREQQAAAAAAAAAQQQASAAPSSPASSSAQAAQPASAYGRSPAPQTSGQQAQPQTQQGAYSAVPSASSRTSGSYNSAAALSAVGSSAAAAGAPVAAAVMSPEDKYTVYRQWLDETKAGRKSSTHSSGAGGGELHHTLLDEDQHSKSTAERYFGACCPVWCFR